MTPSPELNPALRVLKLNRVSWNPASPKLIEKQTKNSTKLVHLRVPEPNGENRIYSYDKIAKQKHRCSSRAYLSTIYIVTASCLVLGLLLSPLSHAEQHSTDQRSFHYRIYQPPPKSMRVHQPSYFNLS